MRRPLALTSLALLLSGCNASDNSVGVNGPDPDPGAAPKAFSRIDLGTLGGPSSYATGINNDAVVVGWSETSTGAIHAFRWTAAIGMADLGTLPGDNASRAIAVVDTRNSAEPQILGVSGDGTRWTPVVWSASGAVTRLPVPSSIDLTARVPTAFNSKGQVVGWDAGSGYQHGWIWSPTDGEYDLSANLTDARGEGTAAAITALGRVLVTSATSSCKYTLECWRTYVWTRASGYSAIGTPSADPETRVAGLDLNDMGTVVGWMSVGTSASTTPYSWSAAKGFRLLPSYSSIGNQYGYATAVNSLGSVVGADLDATTGTILASFWSARGGIKRLSVGDPNPSVAVGINDVNIVAGWATVSAGVNHAVIWTPSSVATGSNLIAPSSLSTIRVTPRSTACLSSVSALVSRQAIFDCVAKADRPR